MRILSWLLMLAGTVLAHSVSAQESRPTVGIYRMEDVAGSGRGDALSAMIESAIVSTNKFRVIEREQMSRINVEDANVRGGRVTSNSGRRRAQAVEGVDYLIYGTITALSGEARSDFGSSLLAGMLSGANNSNTNCGRMRVTLALDIRIVDFDSGEIKYVDRINEVGQSGAQCGGAAQFDPTPLFRTAADRIAGGLVTTIYPIQVAAITPDGTFVLNYGEGTLTLRQMMTVFQAGEPIRDPATGDIIDNNETPLGLICVSEVLPRSSRATALTTFAVQPPVGSHLRPSSDTDRARFTQGDGNRRRRGGGRSC